MGNRNSGGNEIEQKQLAVQIFHLHDHTHQAPLNSNRLAPVLFGGGAAIVTRFFRLSCR